LPFPGTLDHVARSVEALIAAGAALDTPHGLTDPGGIDLLATRVGPAFRV